jgi:hypothetical protein
LNLRAIDTILQEMRTTLIGIASCPTIIAVSVLALLFVAREARVWHPSHPKLFIKTWAAFGGAKLSALAIIAFTPSPIGYFALISATPVLSPEIFFAPHLVTMGGVPLRAGVAVVSSGLVAALLTEMKRRRFF